MKRTLARTGCLLLPAILALGLSGRSMTPRTDEVLDQKVKAFLAGMEHRWRDLNVPAADGEMLYDIVTRSGFTRALEIGTSTGRSGIYIAWALSKTGGRLTTIEIDESRYREALENFRKAGVADLIDARLADAHDLVKTLPGPFDFVFIDADKGWYTNYAKAVIAKLASGGCIAAHNVYDAHAGPDRGGTAGYFAYMKSLAEFDSRILPGGSGSLAVSYKKK
jgi:caffeoyl-CoA O-methyltransferase